VGKAALGAVEFCRQNSIRV